MTESTADLMIKYWTHAEGARLGYIKLSGASPTVVFLCGYQSEMTSTKAAYLHAWCAQRGQAYLRFDYQGHGHSSGAFEDGTIGSWANDAIAIIEALTDGPLVLVGSSMGGWLMLLVARHMPDRVQAMIGIAAAPDFTQYLIDSPISEKQRAVLERDGRIEVPYEGSEGDEMFIMTLALLKESSRHVQLQGRIPLHCPLRLIHGMKDTEVPVSTSQKLLSCMDTEDVRLIMIKDGEHRLSRPQDLTLLAHTLEGVLNEF